MSCGIVSTGSDGVIETTFGTRVMPPDRRNVVEEIEVELVEKCRTDCVRGDDIEERIAVRGCPHRRLGADIATCTGPVLDDELLTEPL
jgi:hypothetical protein